MEVMNNTIEPLEVIISNMFGNSNNAKFFKKIPVRVVGTSNVYLIKINYNYTNQNEYSYLNGCLFKCDVSPEEVTPDDIQIIVNVLPSIKYSTEVIDVNDMNYTKFKYYDGSWFRLYWNQYLQQWKFATSQLINGEIAEWNNVKIGQIFEKYVESIDTTKLDTNLTYFFIYSNPVITFDPSVNDEHIQYIAAVNKEGNICFDEFFPRNSEKIDDKCNVVQLYGNNINLIVQNEMYANIKQHFRTDINTIFLNFYAKPNENMHVMKLFFDTCPRFINMYNEFIHNPLLEALVNSIVNFTKKNINRYFKKMHTIVDKIDSKIFKIWCTLLMRVDPTYQWDHNETPFNNLKNMNVTYVQVLTDHEFVKELLCNIPISDIMQVIS